MNGVPTFAYISLPHRVLYTFTEDVGASLANSDLALVRLPSTATTTTFAYNTAAKVATFTVSGVPNGMLLDGAYRGTMLGANVTDLAGNGIPDSVFNFTFIQGDANNDGAVNLNDFNTLAGSFGGRGQLRRRRLQL